MWISKKNCITFIIIYYYFMISGKRASRCTVTLHESYRVKDVRTRVIQKHVTARSQLCSTL